MTFYDPEDPLGWKQIAAAQQQQSQSWNPNGLPPELLYALAGDITPYDLQDIQAQGGMDAMQQAQPQDPGQAFVDSYGANYMDQAAMEGEAGGLFNQRDYYWWDDLSKREDVLAKRNIAGQKAAYQVFGDERDYGIDQARLELAQGAAERDTRSLGAELGDPAMDRMYLETLGYTPEDFMADMEADPQGTYDQIATLLPMSDQYGNPWNAHPEGVNRMMSLIQSYMGDQQQADMAAQEQAANAPYEMQQQRWGQLTQDERAKEIFLNQQQPGVQRTVAPGGGVHYGEGAEERIAGGYRGAATARPPAGGYGSVRHYKQKGEFDMDKPQGRLEYARNKAGGTKPRVRTKEDVMRAKAKREGKAYKGEKKKKKGGGWTGGLGGALSWLGSPREYAKKNPNARTPAEWFMNR